MSSVSVCRNKRWSPPAVIQACLMVLLMYSPGFAEDTAGEMTLADGLNIAVENSRIVKIASYNTGISTADVLAARSRLLPGINASADQTVLAYRPGARLGPLTAYTAEKGYFSYGIGVRQTLYDFGATGSQYEASKASLERTRLDITRVRNLVALDFVLAYCDLLETEKMISVATKEVERLESHLSVAKSLYQEGVITKNDLLQAEVRLSDAKQRLLTVKNARELNASRLNNILSRPLRSEVKVAETAKEPVLPTHMESLWETSEKHRPELEIIAREIKVVELEEKAKRSEYYPKFFAEGGYNYSENRYALRDENWSLVVGLNINLFSGWATDASVAKVRFRREQLEEQKRKLIEDIKLEVERSFLDMKNASEKVSVSKDAAGQADENLRINKVRYEEGIGTATDVLDAIALLTTAETNYFRAQYDLRRAQAGLLYATGADLVEEYK